MARCVSIGRSPTHTSPGPTVGFDPGRFREIATEITAHLTGLGLTPTSVIPISARNGDGVTRRTSSTAWHTGPTVLEALDAFSPAVKPSELLEKSLARITRLDGMVHAFLRTAEASARVAARPSRPWIARRLARASRAASAMHHCRAKRCQVR